MLTEDYFMRMINLAVAALLRAIGLRKEGQYFEAQQSVDQALEQLTGLRADLLAGLDDRALLDSLSPLGELDYERALLLADLYQEQGEIEKAQGRSEPACSSRMRALTLCLEAALSGSAELTLQDKLDGMLASVQTCGLSFETRFTLYSYYESCGSYAKAEQVLGGLARESQYPEEMQQEYQEFCQRLLDMPEPELARGGLSRGQVKDFLHTHGKPEHPSF